MMKRFFPFIVLLFSVFAADAQEIDATITMNTPRLVNVDKKVFDVLKQQLQEFLNNQKWTEDVYEPHERIKVNISMTILEEKGPTSFSADLNIKVYRPVYGTDYETTTFFTVDKDVDFTYEQYQPIQYSQTSFTDNLSSIFSFYAYYIIGLDADTFSPNGGEPYFNKAQEIQRLVPQGLNPKGWQGASGTRNRYWLIENVLNPRMVGYRNAMYMYHLQGLDAFSSNPEDAKMKFIQALDDINRAAANYPNAMILYIFSLAKVDEITEIGKGLNKIQKTKLVDVMAKVDPANMSKYQQVLYN
jgi:hypothetical protein